MYPLAVHRPTLVQEVNVLHKHSTDDPWLDILCQLSRRHLTSHNVVKSVSWICHPEFHNFLREKMTRMLLSFFFLCTFGYCLSPCVQDTIFLLFPRRAISISWLKIHSMFHINPSSMFPPASNKSARAFSYQGWKFKVICFPGIYLFSIPYARKVESNLDWIKEMPVPFPSSSSLPRGKYRILKINLERSELVSTKKLIAPEINWISRK